MGHGSGPAAAAAADQQQPGCRVLPVIEEEPEPEPEGSGLPEMTRLAERRKAIVARMRELLSRAAAAQSAHSKLRRNTVATAKKWKRAVCRIQRRGKNHQQVAALQEDSTLSSSSSISSHSSFSWDAAAAGESCCGSASASCLSPANGSPLLWPAFVSSRRAETAAEGQQLAASSPATGVLRLSCTSSWSEDDDMRMAHWVTTDSDFVVLEL
ncbi:unnamed protein product [Urochloa decumbens]|uniref:Uncharacterized protein n=1 Tax=Urochloa decumbens TaxID=240449 RepID=A0ABC9CQT8_9POAL